MSGASDKFKRILEAIAWRILEHAIVNVVIPLGAALLGFLGVRDNLWVGATLLCSAVIVVLLGYLIRLKTPRPSIYLPVSLEGAHLPEWSEWAYPEVIQQSWGDLWLFGVPGGKVWLGGLPSGPLDLGGVRFDLRVEGNRFTGGIADDLRRLLPQVRGRCASPAPGNSKRSIDFPVNESGIDAVFFLLTAGNAHRSEPKTGIPLEGQQIGQIVLQFEGTDTQIEPLILGQNIREWYIKSPEDVVNTLPSNSETRQTWTTGEEQATLDILPILVREDLEKRVLERVTIEAELKGQQRLPQDFTFPVIQVLGITCRSSAV